MPLLNKLLSLLMLLVPSLGLGHIATQLGGAEKISDPKIMGAAACYMILEFVLGKTSLIKSNSVVEFVLRSLVGPALYHGLGLKKYGYKIEGAKQ